MTTRTDDMPISEERARMLEKRIDQVDQRISDLQFAILWAMIGIAAALGIALALVYPVGG